MTGLESRITLAQLLVSRLERLSADSYYAHQASGVRGALLRLLSQAQFDRSGDEIEGMERLEALTALGFEILDRAAREV